MKTCIIASFLFACSFTLRATEKVVVSNLGQGWSNGSNFLPLGVPQSGDEVYIPPGLTITVKGNIYSTPPTLKIYTLGTLDFDPSGKLALNGMSLVQLYTGGKITSNGTSSELITIGGLLKYNGATDGTVLGPKFASAGTAVSGPVDDAGFIYGVLPVKLHAFTIAMEGREVTLNWTLSQISGNDAYTLQRKAGGDWEDLKTFTPDAANKNPEVRYTHRDRNPSNGVNLYRLRLRGGDENDAYSPILSAAFSDQKPKTFLFPNPVKDRINVQWGTVMKRGNISIVSGRGEVVYTIDITTPISALALNFSAHKAGTYYLLIKDNGQIIAQLPFVKTD